VRPHFGPTNKKLRCLLPLFVPRDAQAGESSAWLRVHDQTLPLVEGRAVIFDDSFQHEAVNASPSKPRIALILDFWHPDLRDEEVSSGVAARAVRKVLLI
jgi:aspartyl/asparaginyl beta-hydroxylase (cupin superfamily)